VGSHGPTVDAMRAAYNRSAVAWTGGPDGVYGRLAEVLVTAGPIPMTGARVLDVGAGTGAAGRAAIAAGAGQVIAVDIAERMLRALGESGSRVQLVVADAAAARQQLIERGVDASEITVFDERDGGTFFGFSDPDGNSWAVQQIKARAAKPLIPVEARGRFGEEQETP